jgi:hypothetical protein
MLQFFKIIFDIILVSTCGSLTLLSSMRIFEQVSTYFSDSSCIRHALTFSRTTSTSCKDRGYVFSQIFCYFTSDNSSTTVFYKFNRVQRTEEPDTAHHPQPDDSSPHPRNLLT